MTGKRFLSRITYSDGAAEEMSFELFSPEDLINRATPLGLSVVEQCSWWDAARPPDEAEARYQTVFERR